MDDDCKTLAEYGAQDGQVIHCIDTNPAAQAFISEFEDVSRVDKYEISDADYDKRADTFRKFRERQLKMNPNFKSYLGQVDKDHEQEEAKGIEVGSRCETKVGGKRG